MRLTFPALAIICAGCSSTMVPPPPEATHPTNSREEEVAVIEALHRSLDASGAAGCLNAKLDVLAGAESGQARSAQSSEREGKQTAQQIEVAVQRTRNAWTSLRRSEEPLEHATARDLSEAYSRYFFTPRKPRSGIVLTPEEVASDIRLTEDCPARLNRPVIQDDWAFIDRYTGTALLLYALRREAGTWQPLAYKVEVMFATPYPQQDVPPLPAVE